MNLLLKLIHSPSFWVDIFLAISGGLIVFWGLLIEKRAEKYLPPADFKPDIFEDVVKKYKSELERGWRILMFGIVVEVVAAFGISVISSLEIADLTDKSAAANLEAKQAVKDAADAKVLAGLIGTTNAQLVATNLVLASELLGLAQQIQITAQTANETRNLLGDANTTARLNETKSVLAEARQVAADVRTVVTSSNLAALKIENADRTINPDQESNLVSHLKPWTQANFLRKKSVVVIVNQTDFEALRYGKRISDVLKKCGFDVEFVSEIPLGGDQTKVGIGMFMQGKPPPPEFAVRIVNEFSDMGITWTKLYMNTNAPSDNAVTINVWHKPEK